MNMQKFLTIVCVLALLTPVTVDTVYAVSTAHARHGINSQDRRVRGQKGRGYRQPNRGIGYAYRRAGRSAGRGTVRFGKNAVRARPVRATKELGKGAGGFGKYTGIGTVRVGKKIGRGVRRVSPF